MEPWIVTLILGVLGGGGIAGVVTAWATRKKDKSAEIAARLDDASELAQYIRAEIEKAVAPLRGQIEALEKAQHELHDAVRTRETQLWLWDLRGRAGVMPMLPAPILRRLGLGHLIPAEEKE